MHTKELHEIFQNHASYQDSWVSTSTAFNSYPHIIHVNIFSMHIPTSFSQKKKKFCLLFKPINQHANWIFFSSFPAQKKKKAACIYQHHSHKKTTCYSNQEINMQTRFFFSSFLAQKNNMHIPTSFSQKKKHVIRTKKSTLKLDFFLVFQLRKTTCIYQHHSHRKKNCMLF